MISVIAAVLFSIVYSQQPPRECVYRDAGGSRFTLNLTNISAWTFELEQPDHFYYYTPCRNGLNCYQGNADFHSNVIQMKQGANQCTHYLAVDHHEEPIYLDHGAAWMFEYNDGEICDSTQQPRRVRIFYQCAEEERESRIYSINEPNPCEYVIEIRSKEACVPENQYNDECRWRVSNGTGGYYYLNLSPLNTSVLHGYIANRYVEYFSPCRNGLNCYQQTGNHHVMGLIENYATHTCDHYGSLFENGRVQPSLHGVGTDQQHWSFHYYLGEKCSDGTDNFQDVRFFCNETATEPYVLNATVEGDCRFYMNVATTHACI